MANDPYEGMDPLLAARVKKMIADSGGRLWLVSGYRSVEHQRRLYEQGKKKHGKNVNKWVAPPGKSNHNHGLAADISGTEEGKEWAARNHMRYGLWRPMAHEPWHYELPKTAVDVNLDAYTPAPIGSPQAGDPHDIGFQFARMMGMLDAEMTGGVDLGSDTSLVDTQSGGVDLSAGGGAVNALDDDNRMADFGLRMEPSEDEQAVKEAMSDGDY